MTAKASKLCIQAASTKPQSAITVPCATNVSTICEYTMLNGTASRVTGTMAQSCLMDCTRTSE
jgi:hypothetical protein